MSRRDEPSLAGQLSRYARVGAGMGTAVARVAAGRLMSSERDFEAEAKLLGDALGSLKGPLMKVAQLMATIPDLLPRGICRGAGQAAEPCPADGLAVRPPAHGGRAWPRLGSALPELRAGALRPPPRSARSTAPCRLPASRSR